MAPPEAAVVLTDVSWRAGYRWIVRQVSFRIAPGEALLLVGGNGAGKTTILRLAAGLLKPTLGRVERAVTVGFVAHQSMLYDALTARENLRFFGRLHGLADAARIDELLGRLGLAEAADRRVATFSRGMMQRLAVARALLHRPALLLLDEPLSGLDEAGALTVTQFLAELKRQGCAQVIATHQLIELVGHADTVGYIVSGKLAACEPTSEQTAAAVLSRLRALNADAAS